MTVGVDFGSCNIKVEDAFRTLEMQKHLGLQQNTFNAILEKVRWENGDKDPAEDLMLRRLGALVAIAPKVGTHMSGSAIDISVLNAATGVEIDRGAPYIEMSELTPMDSPFISRQAQQNREEITALMARHGFSTYPWEFWHYNAGDAYQQVLGETGVPGRYGAVTLDVATGAVTAVSDPNQFLSTQAEMKALIAQSRAAAAAGAGADSPKL